jgi:(S)-3,5-dihydroxyphenylglycine transaminase
VLLAHGASIAPVVQSKLPHYRASRDRMVAALAAHFADEHEGIAGARWNRPGGGFFVAVRLPFPFGSEELERCAREYGVIVTPMSFFAITPGRERDIRLSFSYVDGPTIDEGVRRLAAFVRDEMARRHAPRARPAAEVEAVIGAQTGVV